MSTIDRDAYRMELYGSWSDKGNYVFPLAFIHRCLIDGKIDDVTSSAMRDARYERGKVRVAPHCAGEVPVWAMDELAKWRAREAVPLT